MKNMFTSVRICLVIVMAIPMVCPRAHAATPKEIDASIARAVNFLYAKQKNGIWEISAPPQPNVPAWVTNKFDGGNWGGLTCIATNALLAAGENQHNPKLKSALDLLINSPLRANPYTLCQRDQALAQLTATPALKKIFKQDGDTYLRVMVTNGPGAGFYIYCGSKGNVWWDHSVSQYGVLGMWICGESGFEVPISYWPVVEKAWINHQEANGGWPYHTKGNGAQATVSASMTAAGVATLFITQDYVHSDEGLTPKGNITNPAIDKGMKWLAENFAEAFESGPLAVNGQCYTLYGIERCGVASGFKFFGKHNWYQEGADWLLKSQNADGSWGNPADHTINIPDTSFAILFLTRGREPVVMNKLAYNVPVGGKSVEGHWNQRPRDVANVCRWIGKQSEHLFNWQIIKLADTAIDDFHDAPILYIAGDQNLDFTPEEDAKLRQFALEGGLILGNPDGNSPQFPKAFQKLASRLFPEYEMRPLPATHPIFTAEQFRGPELSKRPILGLSNGVRELMLCPGSDYGRSWQGRAYSAEDAFRNAANIFLYATGGKNLRKKGETHIIRANPAVVATEKLKIARLDYSGNANPEPAGWIRLAALLHNDDKIDLAVETVKLGENKLAGYKLAHLTGTAVFSLGEEQRKEIAQFTQNGGTLLIDAAGGSTAFCDAVQKELGQIFPDDAGQLTELISATDAVYQRAASPLTFDLRTWALRLQLAKSGPQLRGIKQKDRYVVLFSREDLSNGLVGQDSDGVLGYSPESATAIMRHLVKTLAK